MFHTIKSITTSALLLITLSGSIFAAPLAYRMPAGTTFTLETSTDTELPMVGPKHVDVKATVKVESSSPDGMVLQQAVVAQAPGKPPLSLNLGATLSAEGRISNITGVNLEDPKFSLVAKNAAMALFSLPNEEASVGMTWEDEKPLFLPKLPIPNVPETVRLHNTYKITSIAKQGDRDLVTIEIKTKEADGKVKVDATGTYVVELATGKPVSSTLQGEASLRVILKTFKVPFKTVVTVK